MVKIENEQQQQTEAPPNWLEMIDNIRAVRRKYPAPVDTMGCDQVSERRATKTLDERFAVLVSLMLSSQTKDPITWGAVQKLKQHGICNVDGLMEAREKEIEDLIYPVGFYRRKAIYLKKVAAIIKDNFQGDIPDNLKDLCSLPGVGPKMAHLCMSEAWNVLTGIGVDTHVHRISARLGWVPSKGIKTPEDTRKALESWMPREYWSEINHLLVGFGQTICTPIGPKCDQCFNQTLCPYVRSNPPKKKSSQTPVSSQTSAKDEKPQKSEPKRKSKAAVEKTAAAAKKPKVEVKLEPKIEVEQPKETQVLETVNSGNDVETKTLATEQVLESGIRVKIEEHVFREPELPRPELRRSCRRSQTKTC